MSPGPPPKPPEQRARRNKDVIPTTVLEVVPSGQPALPELSEFGGEPFEWPVVTRDWWRMWGVSPLASAFTDNDWSSLLDTALIHAQYWSGDLKLAAELRMREAKFAATPEDRARLRIQFAVAEKTEKSVNAPVRASARDRRGPLVVEGEAV